MKQTNAWREKRRRGGHAWKYFLMGCLFLAVAAASIRLPSDMLDWQDKKRVGQSQTLPAQEVVLSAQEDMSLLEKLNLLISDNMHVLPMENGKHYTREDVTEKAEEELEKLKELGFLDEVELKWLKFAVPEAAFYLDMENGEHSMMVWNGYAEDGQWMLDYLLDDETGKVLTLQRKRISNNINIGNAEIYDVDGVRKAYQGDVRLGLDAEEAFRELAEKADKWGEYLGCSLKQVVPVMTGIKYQKELYGEIEERMQSLEDRGYSWEDAYQIVCEEMGIVPSDFYERQSVYALYENDEDFVLFYFCRELDDGSFFILNRDFYI